MRTQVRSSTVSGLTLALEAPVGLVRGPFARLWRPEPAEKGTPRIELGVRLTWPAPEPGPLNIVRSIGPQRRIAASGDAWRFSGLTTRGEFAVALTRRGAAWSEARLRDAVGLPPRRRPWRAR